MATIAATAAGMLLARMHTLLVGASSPNARGFMLSFVQLTPWARLLTKSFSSIRSRFAGLVHRHVEIFGYRGSSALHVLAQVAGLIARAGEGHVPWGEASVSPEFTMKVAERLSSELSDAQVAQLASDLREAVPFDVSNTLHTMIEVELATLERQLGQRITQGFGAFSRPSFLDGIARKIDQYIQPPVVVHAPTFEMALPQSSTSPPAPLDKYQSNIMDASGPLASDEQGFNLFVKQGSGWRIRFAAKEIFVPDMKGALHVWTLLQNSGRPVSALQLCGVEADVIHTHVDSQAIQAYHRRLKDIASLRAEGCTPEKIADLEVEENLIRKFVSQGTGRDGHVGKFEDARGRARSAVGHAIRAFLRVLARDLPELHRHLKKNLLTTSGHHPQYVGTESVRWMLGG